MANARHSVFGDFFAHDPVLEQVGVFRRDGEASVVPHLANALGVAMAGEQDKHLVGFVFSVDSSDRVVKPFERVGRLRH